MAGTNADEINAHAGPANGAAHSAVGDGLGDGVSAAGRVAGDARAMDRGVAYGLTVETQRARDLLADMRDLLGDDADAIGMTVESETNLQEAMHAALKRLAELNGLMNGIVGMIANLKDRGERLEKQRDTIRELLCVAMETAGQKKLETPLGTVSLRAVPPKAEIIDEALIPSRFWKPQDPKLDRKAVLDALKAKEAIPGATLSNGGMTISVKLD